MPNQCPFCQLEKTSVVLENELVFTFFDKYPVQKGHLLIVPKRHVETYFDATAEEIASIHQHINSLDREKSLLMRTIFQMATILG
ncbi:HIT family protein [Aneurinibacillus tyrosinisolvens]|jgi:diadenosine tetraphosphate (Ap4A) HIT family hydrolase|uniref:HIT family protein n=1 Tax=Aneurinibacillus tyrosinisolvens TaxID=1443435 RepID=UPI000AD4AD13|nr:HIT family protein [Aneurinibacillus tyrosinisolvens]